jgi:hypothetical protein
MWGVYAEHTANGNNLSCWVCTRAAAITAGCGGAFLIPDTEWDMREQAGAAACVLKAIGKCLAVQNYRCGNDSPGAHVRRAP